MLKYLLLLVVLTVLTGSCTNRQKREKPKSISRSIVKDDRKTGNLKAVLKKSMNFFADSLLNGNRTVIQGYIEKYQIDSCRIIIYPDSNLKAEFEGVKAIKGISGNKTTDSVFVMPPFNYCEEGQSYCFYDKTLPRLYTDSYCCHPGNLFVTEDIDEDGIKEIGIYYSSCASRYKVLKIYSLKNGKWEQIGDSDFDIFMRDPEKVQFDQLVKKISKGKFKICNFLDGNTKWETITMKY
jgi:hypothetical protein